MPRKLEKQMEKVKNMRKIRRLTLYEQILLKIQIRNYKRKYTKK